MCFMGSGAQPFFMGGGRAFVMNGMGGGNAMHAAQEDNIFSLPDLRDRTMIFPGREEAGRVLAEMLEPYRGTDTTILAIPSGGIPVGVAIAEHLLLPLEAAVVSKITLPWNTEAGYGAVAFDGTLQMNRDLLRHLRLAEGETAEGISKTRAKVARRVQKFRGDRPWPDLSGRSAVLVDDGLASGLTMLVAVEAVRGLKARKIVVAVPTGSADRLDRVAREVDALYCANVRGGWRFAVAEAYRNWFDLDEEEAVRLYEEYLRRFEGKTGSGR